MLILWNHILSLIKKTALKPEDFFMIKIQDEQGIDKSWMGTMKLEFEWGIYDIF